MSNKNNCSFKVVNRKEKISSLENLESVFFRLAQNLSIERIKKGFGIAELSALTGIDESHLYRIEKAQKKIGLIALIKICTALEININDLLDLDFEENKRVETIYSITKHLDDEEFEAISNIIKTYTENIRNIIG